jgi:hypothetical protein
MKPEIVVPLSLFACGALAGVALAQGEVVSLPVGSLIDYGPNEVLKIVSCGPDPQWGTQNCKYEVYRNGQLVGGGLRSEPADRLLVFLNETRAKKGLPPLGRAGQVANPPQPAAASAPDRARNADADAAPAASAGGEGQCPKTPYVRFPAATKPTPAVLKQVMASGHTFPRPAFLWSGVTFESFSVGPPVTNVVRTVPGRGAQRLNDAFPPNARMYPVKAAYVVCDQYRSGPERFRIVTGNYCAVDRNSQWACGADSDVARYSSTKLN